MKTPLSIKIRPAQIGEEGLLLELIRELALYEGKNLESLPLTKEKLAQYGFGAEKLFFTEFAELDEQVIGYALYAYKFSANQGRPVLYLEDLYVRSAYQRLGIGSQLIKKIAQIAHENDCCRMEWHVFDWNLPAIAFYKKMGTQLKNEAILCCLDRHEMQLLC